MTISIGDYNTIMEHRNIFNQIVYTPLSEALRLLEERQKDPLLVVKINELLKGDIPEVLKNKKCGVLNRNIATPNYESKRFISLANENNLHPTFFEYHNDKFAPENQFKYFLGKIVSYNGVGKNGGEKKDYLNIIDFNKSNGKKLIDIVTLSDEPLTVFHRNLFKKHNLNDNISFLELSDWFKNNGNIPANYYFNFFLLFVCNGILFENFLLQGNEKGFTRDIILPAFEKIINLTGVKPLIVPIEPTDIESDEYWYYYDNIN